MSEEDIKGFGAYNPQAADHGPYNEAMAEWRNQVLAMQQAGTLPGSPEAVVADETLSERPAEDPGGEDAQEPQMSLQGDSEGGEELVPAPQPDPAEQGSAEPEDDEPHEVYDPAQHNAPEVLDYLKGVGYEEACRVLESEEAGRNRKGIVNLKSDILTKARNNDETGSGSKSA